MCVYHFHQLLDKSMMALVWAKLGESHRVLGKHQKWITAEKSCVIHHISSPVRQPMSSSVHQHHHDHHHNQHHHHHHLNSHHSRGPFVFFCRVAIFSWWVCGTGKPSRKTISNITRGAHMKVCGHWGVKYSPKRIIFSVEYQGLGLSAIWEKHPCDCNMSPTTTDLWFAETQLPWNFRFLQRPPKSNMECGKNIPRNLIAGIKPTPSQRLPFARGILSCEWFTEEVP